MSKSASMEQAAPGEHASPGAAPTSHQVVWAGFPADVQCPQAGDVAVQRRQRTFSLASTTATRTENSGCEKAMAVASASGSIDTA